MYIKINNFTKTISGKTVLQDINFNFEHGKIYGLKGKNGSGKTMLMRAICGLINPTSGNVDVNGKILGKDISFPESIGALIETPGFIANYSGFKNLKILSSIKNKINDKKITETLSLLKLDPNDKKKFKQYSLGMKQKLGIAAAIMEDPEIIILDEPINALDENTVDIVKEILYDRRNKGVLIIVSCHDKEELEYLSDEVLFIEDGKLKGNQTIQK